MKKSILEEYQKRVENILTTLNSNQAIVIEGVETSQIRTDNRLAELQSMLEEAQRPIDMSDVGIGVTGIFVRDSRVSTMRDSYSDDREGYLLSEYDKRRLDPDEPTANVERVVEEIRQVREERRRAQEEAIRAEMQDLIDEQARIESVRAAQAEKALVSMQLQEEKDSIASEIETKRAKIEEEKNRADKALGEMKIHKATLALYKDLKSRVYTVASAEVQKCGERARSAETRIASLNKRIERLQQESGDIEALLQSMDEKTKEFSEQEDEMWEEYRAELAKDEEKIDRDRDIEYGWAQHDLEEKRAEMREKALEEKEKASEEQAIEQYADGLNPEEDFLKPEDFSRYDNWKPSTTVDNPQKPEKPQKPDAPQPPKPSEKPEKQEPPKPQNPQPTRMSPTAGKWKIESATFTIEGGSKPVYKILVSNGKEQKEVISEKIEVLDISRDKEEIATLTNKQKIQNVEKYYDKGLATALQEADREYGTNGFEEYKQLLRDKEMIHRYPDRYEDSLKINYDFSNLLVKPNENMKKLQKIAQANQSKGVVSRMKKRPNFLMRLIKRIFVKSLPEAVETEPVQKASKKEEIEETMEEYLREGREEVSTYRMMQDWEEMHSEPGFDIEAFVAGLSETEANIYRDLQEQYEKSTKENPYEGFRSRMKKEAQTDKVQEKVAEEVKKAMDEKSEELDDPFLDL